VPHHPVRGHDHHRWHGVAARRDTGSSVRHPVPLLDRGRPAGAARRPALRGRGLCRQLRGVRPRDDSLSRLRAARPRRHLASRPALFPSLAVPPAAGGGLAPMTAPLLAVEKLEVTYQRAITAVQGITLSVERGRIVALLGTNGAGKTTTLRAISGFLGIDDA